MLKGTGAFGLPGPRVQPHVEKATSHGSVSVTTLHHRRGAEGAQAAPGRHNLATIHSAPVSTQIHKQAALWNVDGSQENDVFVCSCWRLDELD